MDFHSLLRRDLQFLCKRNKIPANMTNVAMADALKALEIVEGLDEFMNQSNSKAPQSPTSVAKQPPITATRTTRRKTSTVKADSQSSSQLITGSCRLTSKSLAGEMDQENVNKNVVQEPKANNVPKTPAARTTRKASAAISCSSKVQESKKDELVQSVYSTRRSTRLLEKCMADLSLKTKETLEKPAKNEVTEHTVSAQEKNPAGSEVEVIPGRDLNASMEQVWENLKNDNDQVAGDLEIYVDLGDTAVSGANTETKEEKMNEVAGDEKESDNSLVQVDKEEEMLPPMCEEDQTKNDNDEKIEDQEIYVDLGDNIETHSDDKVESKNVQAFDSLAPVNQQETEKTIQENDFEFEKLKNFEEETMVDQTVSDDAGDAKTEQAIQENDSEAEKITNFYEGNKTDSDAGDSDTEAEEDDSGVDSDGTISEADSNQAVMGSADSNQLLGSNIADEETMVDQTVSNAGDSKTEQAILENDTEPEKITTLDEDYNSGVDSDGTISEADSNQAVMGSADSNQLLGSDIADEETMVDQTVSNAGDSKTEQAILENDSEPEKITTLDEDYKTDSDAGDSETEAEEDDSGVDSDGTFSEADSNQAVMGSDIADEEITLSESEPSAAAPASPPLLREEAEVKTIPLSPFTEEPISVQFPRPSKPTTTTPLKNSALKMVIENKENNMEMMMNVNNNENGENKGEEGKKKKKKKKVTIDEDNLKVMSMRQLEKMLKELSIKSSNRTALQILPANNQTAE